MDYSRFPIIILLTAVASFVSISEAKAVNRFKINNQTLPCGTTSAVVPVLADVDQDTYGLSISLEYDRNKIQIASVETGSAVAALDPEYADGTEDNDKGQLVWGIVFDLSDPMTKHLAPGTNREVLVLNLDVLTSGTTATLNLLNVAGAPARLNVMTNEDGASVSPAPTLVDGTLTLRGSPQVTSVSPSSGAPGTTLTISGSSFDQPDLTVEIGGRLVNEGDVTVVSATQLRVVAPSCSPGDLDVKVCAGTDPGCCDVETNAFECTGPPVPVIKSYVVGAENLPQASGLAGDEIFIIGQNFDKGNLQVRICDEPAPILSSSGSQIEVTVPECDQSGCVPVQVCTDIGCDTDADGFCYAYGPVISSYVDADLQPVDQVEGRAGDEIFIIGQHFDEPNLTVTICGEEAEILSNSNSQIEVVLPSCDQTGCIEVEVCTEAGCASDPDGVCYEAGTLFVRGNANNSGDNQVDLSDAIAIFNDLFLGIPSPAPCRDALDSNDDGSTDISDGVWILMFLFQGGPSIKEPYPLPGLDPTPDALPDC